MFVGAVYEGIFKFMIKKQMKNPLEINPVYKNNTNVIDLTL